MATLRAHVLPDSTRSGVTVPLSTRALMATLRAHALPDSTRSFSVYPYRLL